MEKKLINLWKTCETKQLAKIFKEYMESMKVKKWDGRKNKNNNLDTYFINGKDTNWNRVTCYYYKDCRNYADENLAIILRKRSGSYLIIQKKGKRAFEVTPSGVLQYNESLFKEILEEHQLLFDILLKRI